jgi:hypothetical protein
MIRMYFRLQLQHIETACLAVIQDFVLRHIALALGTCRLQSDEISSV